MSVQDAIDKSKAVADAIDRDLNGVILPATDRDQLSAALLDQVHEHHRAIHLLLQSGLTGSAFSLVRIMFETMVRGIWLKYSATDEEVEKFKADRLEKYLQDIIDQVEAQFGAENGALSKIKEKAWKAMCSYAHGGYFQAVRRLTEDHITPNYGNEEKIEVVKLSDFCFLLSAIVSFSMSDRADLADKWSELSQ